MGSLKINCALTAIVAITALSACGGGNPSSGDNNQGVGTGSGGDEPDAVVVDIPIAYVRRAIPFDEEGEFIELDALEPTQFVPGAELFIRERADAVAQEINITAGVFPEGELYDIKDLVASNDGSKLLFSMRAPEIENADEDEQPTWNIWEYDLETEVLRRIINDDITAEAGQDLNPAYLPDGRIIFSSDRQVRAKAILLDDGKPQYEAQTDDGDQNALLLHVMNEFGADIRQLSYNQSHDLQATVLSNGLIAFNRWNNKQRIDRLSLFTTRPDGQDTQELYGFNSQDTGTNGTEIVFFDPKPMADGRLLALARTEQSRNWGGDLLAIDIDNYSDINQDINLPLSDDPGGDTTTPGQQSLAFGEIIVDNDDTSISRNGYFAAATDLFDDTPRLLVAWTDCRLQDPNDPDVVLACIDSNLAIEGIQEAEPLYSLWIYNLDEVTLQPLFAATPGFMYTDVVSFGVRFEDAFLADRQGGVELDQSFVDEGVAELHIRNVYEVDGVDTAGIAALADPAQTTADERPARFLKIEKAVSFPDEDVYDFDNSAFGFSNTMREIIGYAPIEPDGSVKTLIPADVALTLALTNAEGQRITNTTALWFTARPGEQIESNDLTVGLRRLDATQPSTNPGAPTDGFNFANTEPLLIAQAGETMAETWARINGIRRTSVDLIYSDDWTDPAVRAKDASFEYRYANLTTPAPTSAACVASWTAACRIIVHYPDHIQPLWDLGRQTLDGDGNVLSDYTCTVCHNVVDDMGQTMVPEGQLELTQGPLDTNNQFRSFRELGANDIEFELNEDGVLVPVMVLVLDGNGDPIPVLDAEGEIVFQLDEDGNPILDGDGNPIPEFEMTTVTVPRSIAPSNAQGSRFFDLFAAGGSHEGFLSGDELKLISEWLDLGGQYYNNPFDAPAD